MQKSFPNGPYLQANAQSYGDCAQRCSSKQLREYAHQAARSAAGRQREPSSDAAFAKEKDHTDDLERFFDGRSSLTGPAEADDP
jgi:hypothetical protein